MKKVLGILAVSAALVGFSACGGDDGGSSVQGTPELAADKISQTKEGDVFAVDRDCALETFADMSQDDLNIIVNDGDAEKLSEEGQAMYLSALQDCATETDAAAEEEMTEETTA